MTDWTEIAMPRVLTWGLLVLLPFAAAWAQPPTAAAQASVHRAELSYALGYAAGIDLGQRQPNVDVEAVLHGVKDGYARKQPQYSPEVMQQVMETMRQQMLAQARTAYRRLAAANLQKSQDFFQHNARKQGVVTLPSGVQYKVLGGGTSDKHPTVASEVTLQYRGALLDGTVFDNTEDRGKPVVFPVDHMIPGWREIITRMQVGDHWQVFIPPDQAYGARGEPPRIGPNQALVFDIHLLGVQP